MNSPQYVFKYRSGSDRDISNLKDAVFYSAKVEELNDLCERVFEIDPVVGFFSSVMKSASGHDQYGNLFESSLRSLENIKLQLGIFSLSTELKSQLMWAHYANSNSGFCIEFDRNYFYGFLRGEEFSGVNYVDVLPKMDVIDLMSDKDAKNDCINKIVFCKKKEWSYEKEWRYVFGESGLKFYDYRAVKSIYFAARAETKMINDVMAALAGRSTKYYKMTLDNKSGTLDYR